MSESEIDRLIKTGLSRKEAIAWVEENKDKSDVPPRTGGIAGNNAIADINPELLPPILVMFRQMEELEEWLNRDSRRWRRLPY